MADGSGSNAFMNEGLFIRNDNKADNFVKAMYGLLPMPYFKHRIIGITVYCGWYQPPKIEHIVPGYATSKINSIVAEIKILSTLFKPLDFQGKYRFMLLSKTTSTKRFINSPMRFNDYR